MNFGVLEGRVQKEAFYRFNFSLARSPEENKCIEMQVKLRSCKANRVDEQKLKAKLHFWAF